MTGLRLNWKCFGCSSTNHTEIGFASVYEVDGDSAYIKVKCNNCGKVHFVNTIGGKVIEETDSMLVKQIGTCMM